jgi:hypothetical protein
LLAAHLLNLEKSFRKGQDLLLKAKFGTQKLIFLIKLHTSKECLSLTVDIQSDLFLFQSYQKLAFKELYSCLLEFSKILQFNLVSLDILLESKELDIFRKLLQKF